MLTRRHKRNRMKKNYIAPVMKVNVLYTKDIMQITAVSGGYEQGVGGQGSGDEARSGTSIF